MTAKKKAANKTAKNSINNAIVAQIARNEPAEYLSADDAVRYKNAKKRYWDLQEQRDREMREKYPDLDRASEEYNRISNSLYRREINSALNIWAPLEDVAREAFQERHRGQDAELLAALRIVATRRIVSNRNDVYAEIERTGWSGEPEKIEGMSIAEKLANRDRKAIKEPPRSHPAEYAIIETFTPFMLNLYISQDCEYILTALSDDGYIQADEIIRELIKQRWTLKPLDRQGIINARGDVTLLTSSALVQMQAASAHTAEYNEVSRAYTHTWKATNVYITGGAKPYSNSTIKILNYLLARFYLQNQGDRKIRISHTPNICVFVLKDEAMRMFGWTNADSARKMLRDAFKTMENTIIETEDYYWYIDDKGRERRKIYGKGNPRIVSSVKSVKGGYRVYIDGQFAEYLVGSFALDVPVEYFSASANASAIMVKLANHAQMNRNKSNAKIISAHALIEACPEIESKNERSGERIAEKLDKALEELERARVIKFEYREKCNRPISRPSVLDYNKSEIMDDICILFELVHAGETIPLPELLELPTK